MSDGAVAAVIIVCLTLALSTCSVANNWRIVEIEKIQLEREKLGGRK